MMLYKISLTGSEDQLNLASKTTKRCPDMSIFAP